MAAQAHISSGDYSSESVAMALNMPRISERAKMAFIHHSLCQLERTDVYGALARERFRSAARSNFESNIDINRVAAMHRWVQQSGLELTPNTKAADPDSPELTKPVAIVDVDRQNSVHTITLGATNTLPLSKDPITHDALT